MHVESQQVNRKETWDVHYRRNMMESRCKDPKPQVFPSSTDPSRSYVPRCTVLHRCSDDTACCPSADKTCVANTTELIELEFIVTFLNNTNRRLYETFLNHTSCHCVTKPKYSSSLRNVPVSLIQPKRCDCPRIFTEILQENGDCKCECSSHECQVKRKGQEHFSLEERSCISRGLCNKPRCNYGHYVSKEGRCPRLEEKFESRNQQSQSRLY
uniref:CSON000546 protein n=1 Tax=Culicoides sonorensis TaxID=179676 RepID=A0A336LPW9_CULSO